MIYQIDDRYELRPISNGLCFEVFKYKSVKDRETGEKTEKWVSLGRYGSNLSHALRIVFNDMIRNNEGTVKGLKATIAKVEEIEQRVMDYREKR